MRAHTLISLALCAPSLLWAQPQSIVLLPIETQNQESAKDAAERLRIAMQDGVAQADNLSLKGPVNISLEEVRMAFSCFDLRAECVAKVGEQIGADLLVWGRFLPQEGASQWKLELNLVDVATGASVRTRENLVANLGEYKTLFRWAQGFILDRSLEASVAVEISSKPAGALLYIDGQEMGRTPLKASVEPGSHQFTLKLAGYQEISEYKNVRDNNEKRVLDYHLTPEFDVGGVGGQGEGLGAREWLTIGLGTGAALSLGAAGLTYLMSTNIEDEVRKNPARESELKDEHDTLKGVHLTTFILGGALAVGAVATWFFYPQDEKAGEAQSVRWLVGPTGASVMGHF